MQVDGCPPIAVGYQPPQVEECYKINDEVLSRIVANDPDITGLEVNSYDLLNDDDDHANKIGRVISNSSYLRRLELWGSWKCRNGVQYFFAWLAHNRSIEHLKMDHLDLSEIDFFQILAPIVEHNINLRCIEITHSRSVGKRMPSLIFALSHTGGNRLEKLNLHQNYIGDEKAADLLNALNGMPGLHNLLELDLSENEIGRKGFMALCALLKNSECRIQTLNLIRNCLDVECMGTLISGLATNTSIRTLSLWSPTKLTAIGWHIFFIFVSSPRCSLEKIDVLGDIRDESASFLGDSLAVNMKSLSIGGTDFTTTGWREFSRGLSASSSTLVEFIMEECNIDDEGAVEVFLALANNTTLTKLALSYNQHMTSEGWVECFQQLRGSQTALVKLKFVSNLIDDEGASILVNLLSTQFSTVRLLDVQFNTSITTSGWRAFSELLLPSSKAKLTTLRIGGEDCDEIVPQINDDVIFDYVAALESNNSLTEFDIGHVEIISPPTLDALSKVLCDKTSISSTCASNHTLNIFKYTCNNDDEDDQCRIEQLDSLLELNKNNDKAEVVREKILKSSILKNDTVGIAFGCMPVAVFPSVIEWIGRDRLGFSAMYCLTQNYPSLLEHQSQPEVDYFALLDSPRKLRKVE